MGFIGLGLLVFAAVSALYVASGPWFATYARPPGVSSRPLAGTATWSSLALMGCGGWRLWRRLPEAAQALRRWGWHLLVSAGWAALLFGGHLLTLGAAAAVLALASAAGLVLKSVRHDRLAAGLMVPSLFWSVYAAYLAVGTWWLSKG